MKIIDSHQAGAYLSTIGMRLGDWNNVESASSGDGHFSQWERVSAPSINLLNFSHHIASWLPRGRWKLIQFDNSSGWIDPVQSSFLAAVLRCSAANADFNDKERSTILFEFDAEANAFQELDFGNLVYALLLFELHAYVASSECAVGEMLVIQDGFVYFRGDESSIARGRSIVEAFSRFPTAYPDWIADLVAREQEATMIR